ncbi:MAG: TonB-dependent siderophore receptor [Cyanothece sp. SIO1E1]|nr:TonB-dependent siderophore receptor [Cyanothece sp. SIO1E1]
MMMRLHLLFGSVVGMPVLAIPLALTPNVYAQEIMTLSDLDQPATTLDEWVAQRSAPIQITDIQLNPTDTGVEIILVTESGTLSPPAIQRVENAMIAEISNAVLELSGEDEFQVFDPVEGIVLIEALPMAEQTVQLTITGTDAPPAAEVRAENQNLVLNVVLGDSTTTVANDETIQMVVTGEQDNRYFKPSATTATRTETPIRDIPQSIQVIPRELLEDQQIIRLDDALRNVSGVNFEGVDTGAIDHTLVFGVDLNRRNEDGPTKFDFFNPVPLDIFNPVFAAFPRPDFDELPVLADSDDETDRLGIFIQDQLSFFDNFLLLAGVRYDTVAQERMGGPSLFAPNGTDETQTDDAFSPRVGLVYQPIEVVSLYASYSRSFTPNTGTSVDGRFLQPEQGEGFEVGVKAEFLNRGLAATLAYFDITKQNVATADPDFPDFSIATGEQKSRGVELDMIGEILPGWNMIASYAFIDAEVTEDNTIQVDNRLNGIPKHSASLWTTYEIQSGNLQGLGFGLGFNFVGAREGDLNNTFELDSYFLTNAALSYRRNNWRVALNFRNLFDIDYIAGPAGNARVRSNDPGEPFTVLGSISVKF